MIFRNELCGDEKCPGLAIPTAKDGRFYQHPKHDWLRIAIPADSIVHRCNTCNADWLYDDNHTKIPAFLESSYQEHATMIKGIVDDYRAKMKREAADK